MRAVAVIVLIAACGGDDPVVSRTRVYVGTYTSQIQAFSMDPDTFALTPAGATDTGMFPSFLAFDPQGRWLVASEEGGATVESFLIGADGALAPVGGQSVGDQPAHVSLDQTGTWVFTANFGAGTVSVLSIDADATLGPATEVAADDTVHQLVVHPNNELAFAPCLEANGIVSYAFDAATGVLAATTSVSAPAGAGPRHLAISSTGGFAWLMNEVGSSVTTFRIARDGVLTELATVSALPAGFIGTNKSAEIALHPNGKWLFASNRGHDSIAVFDVAGDGSLTLLANVATGMEPRHFTIVPGGAGMLVGNQSSDTITAFRVDPDTGALTAVGEVASVDNPAFIGVVELP